MRHEIFFQIPDGLPDGSHSFTETKSDGSENVIVVRLANKEVVHMRVNNDLFDWHDEPEFYDTSATPPYQKGKRIILKLNGEAVQWTEFNSLNRWSRYEDGDYYHFNGNGKIKSFKQGDSRIEYIYKETTTQSATGSGGSNIFETVQTNILEKIEFYENDKLLKSVRYNGTL